jgi:hypothetical protein
MEPVAPSSSTSTTATRAKSQGEPCAILMGPCRTQRRRLAGTWRPECSGSALTGRFTTGAGRASDPRRFAEPARADCTARRDGLSRESTVAGDTLRLGYRTVRHPFRALSVDFRVRAAGLPDLPLPPRMDRALPPRATTSQVLGPVLPSFPVRLSTPRPGLQSNALTPEIVLLKYRFKPSNTVGLGQPARLCAGRQRDDVARLQSTTDERSGCTWPAVGLSPDSTCEPA